MVRAKDGNNTLGAGGLPSQPDIDPALRAFLRQCREMVARQGEMEIADPLLQQDSLMAEGVDGRWASWRSDCSHALTESSGKYPGLVPAGGAGGFYPRTRRLLVASSIDVIEPVTSVAVRASHGCRLRMMGIGNGMILR